jgi:peptidoglycan/LPS O-acetylase OafA/YrhL
VRVSDPATRRRVRVAAAICVLEAVASLGMAVAELVSIDPGRASVGITTAVFFLLYGLGLGFAARGLDRLSSWSRGPVVLAQLIQLGVAWSFRGGSTTWVALLLAVPAVIVVFIVFSPTTTKALYGERESDQFRGPADRS